MIKPRIHLHGIKAFTLLEISVVLVLIAMIGGGGLVVLTASVQQSAYNNTVATMQAIDTALLNFKTASGRLPCPADLTISPSDATTGTYYKTTRSADYGLEAGSDPSSAIAAGTGVCKGTNMTPTSNFYSAACSYTAAYSCSVAEGSVPVRTLRLPDNFMYDGWGNRIRYAVDPNVTIAGSLAPAPGGTCSSAPITVCDSAGYSGSACVNTARSTSAIYALVSHGANGYGAFTQNGTLSSVSPTNANEQINCHAGNTGVCTGSSVSSGMTVTAQVAPVYVQQLPGYQSGHAGNPAYNFDDIVSFKEVWQLHTPNDDLLTPAMCIVVADGNNNRIERFQYRNGAWAYTDMDSGFSGATVDSNLNIWTLGWGGGQNSKLDKHYNVLITGTSPPTACNSSAAVDSSDNVYIGNMCCSGPCGAVEELSSSAVAVRAFTSDFSTNCSAQGNVCNGGASNTDGAGVAVDSSGNVWIVDLAHLRIEKFNNSGTWQMSIGGSNTTPGDSSNNCSAATGGGANGQATAGNVGFCGTDQTACSGCAVGTADGQFNFGGLLPVGIAVDKSGNLWVPDSTNYRIQEFSSAGVWLQTIGGGASCTSCSPTASSCTCSTGVFGGYGNGAPTTLAIDPSGNVWAAEEGTSFARIQEFSNTGQLLFATGNLNGTGAGQILSSSGSFNFTVYSAANIGNAR